MDHSADASASDAPPPAARRARHGSTQTRYHAGSWAYNDVENMTDAELRRLVALGEHAGAARSVLAHRTSEREAHDIESADAARAVLARRSPEREAHALERYSSPAAIAYTLHSVKAVARSDARPTDDVMSTAMIIDTGASLHLENHTGSAGYVGARHPSSTYISTGMTERSPVDFEGHHVQYVLGDAPGYEVIELARPAVAMRCSDFRKVLWSPSVAYKESGIESYFNGSPHLKLPDGKKVPLLEVDHIYALPRWTSRAQAEHARGIFLQDKVLYACPSEA